MEGKSVEVKQVSEREIWVGEDRFYLGDDNIIYVSIKGDHNKKIAMAMKDAFYQLLDMIEDQGNVFVDNSQTGKPSLNKNIQIFNTEEALS